MLSIVPPLSHSHFLFTPFSLVYRNNTGGSLLLYKDRNIHVQNCTFMNNNGSRPDPDRTNVIVTLSFSSGGMAMIFDQTSHTSALINGCKFVNNSANIHYLNANDSRPISYTPIGNGGALLARFANCHNNNVTIINCTFVNNTAKYSGGCIYTPMIRKAINNTVEISNCVFDSSNATGAGGAVSMDIFDNGETNRMNISDSRFQNNQAWLGGGALSIVHQDSLNQTQGIEGTIAFLKNCTFDSNQSPTGGSAVGLVSNVRVNQRSPTVSFTDWYVVSP